jgi:DNA-binding CsgD family transcriptional regulator
MDEPQIAIIDSNTLSCIGLKNILEEIFPRITIRTFCSFGDFIDDTPDMYMHYFIASQVYIEHRAFFKPRLIKTIVLAAESQSFQLADVRMLNIYQSEKELIKSLLKLEQNGHRKHSDDVRIPHWNTMQHILSPRETEVLVLLVKGYINKEIADKLHISLSTVITHRKNITEKLGIKSVSKLTIYAVMNGYVEADRI